MPPPPRVPPPSILVSLNTKSEHKINLFQIYSICGSHKIKKNAARYSRAFHPPGYATSPDECTLYLSQIRIFISERNCILCISTNNHEYLSQRVSYSKCELRLLRLLDLANIGRDFSRGPLMGRIFRPLINEIILFGAVGV